MWQRGPGSEGRACAGALGSECSRATAHTALPGTTRLCADPGRGRRHHHGSEAPRASVMPSCVRGCSRCTRHLPALSCVSTGRASALAPGLGRAAAGAHRRASLLDVTQLVSHSWLRPAPAIAGCAQKGTHSRDQISAAYQAGRRQQTSRVHYCSSSGGRAAATYRRGRRPNRGPCARIHSPRTIALNHPRPLWGRWLRQWSEDRGAGTTDAG